MMGTASSQEIQNTQSISDTDQKADVETIYKNPMPFLNKQISLTGVVTISFPNENMFMITDPVGCGSGCGSKCTINLIPVSYSGEIPKEKDIVQINGVLVKDKNNKILFNASSLKSQ